MKMIKKMSLLFLGSVFGISLMVACGTQGMTNLARAVATIIGAANQVSYDNTTSGLKATDVQGAVDEVVSDAKSLAVALNPNSITGTWAFVKAFDPSKTTVGTIIFDGTSLTYSATGNNGLFGETQQGSVLLYGTQLIYDPSGDSNSSEASSYTIAIANTTMVLSRGGDIYIGTKQ